MIPPWPLGYTTRRRKPTPSGSTLAHTAPNQLHGDFRPIIAVPSSFYPTSVFFHRFLSLPSGSSSFVRTARALTVPPLLPVSRLPSPVTRPIRNWQFGLANFSQPKNTDQSTAVRFFLSLITH